MASTDVVQAAVDAPYSVSIKKQQQWILFLRHCAKCRESEDACSLKEQCKFGKQLWRHLMNCANGQCDFPRCKRSKELLAHHSKCTDVACAVCIPVKDYVRRTRAMTHAPSGERVVPASGGPRTPAAPAAAGPASSGGVRDPGGNSVATALRKRQREGECPVCLCEMHVGVETCTSLRSCRHTFHSGCLRRWLGVRRECPLCRGQVGAADLPQ